MAIISFRYNFIFLKTVKTAGTSIEADLASLLDENDIVTPILPPLSKHTARNYQDSSGEAVFYNHMSAQKVRNLIGPDPFERMFKFCVEREPVEKCISHFHMLRNSDLHNPGNEYRASWQEYCEAGRFPVNLPIYTEMIDGQYRLLVDRVLRYDALAVELAEVMKACGLPEFRLTSRAKSEYSRNQLIRKEDVTPAQRDKIYTAFQKTLDVTGIDWTCAPSSQRSENP